MAGRKAKILRAWKAEHSFYALQAVAERVLILFILDFMEIR